MLYTHTHNIYKKNKVQDKNFSILASRVRIDKDITYKSKISWNKWKSTSFIFYNHKVPLKFYKPNIRPMIF